MAEKRSPPPSPQKKSKGQVFYRSIFRASCQLATGLPARCLHNLAKLAHLSAPLWQKSLCVATSYLYPPSNPANGQTKAAAAGRRGGRDQRRSNSFLWCHWQKIGFHSRPQQRQFSPSPSEVNGNITLLKRPFLLDRRSLTRAFMAQLYEGRKEGSQTVLEL